MVEKRNVTPDRDRLRFAVGRTAGALALLRDVVRGRASLDLLSQAERNLWIAWALVQEARGRRAA